MAGLVRSTSPYRTGESHAANGSPSSEHSNDAPASLAVKLNVALVLEVVASGPEVIVVSGGTATVHSYSAGVSSGIPAEFFACTSNVCGPSIRLL
jgi:hypothetical protein